MRQRLPGLLKDPQPGDHFARLYQDPISLINALEVYIGTGLERGEAAIVLAVRHHREQLQRRLEQRGMNCQSLAASGQLAFLDAHAALEQIMHAGPGRPDRETFDALIRPAIRRGLSQFGRLRAYGELVNVLWQHADRPAAHTLEQWWNGLIDEYRFSLLCAYRANVFDNNHGMQAALEQVCQTHSHFIPVDDDDRLERAVDAALQTVVPDADVPKMRQGLQARHRRATRMPEAQATLLALDEILPPLAQDVRTLAREYYHHH